MRCPKSPQLKHVLGIREISEQKPPRLGFPTYLAVLKAKADGRSRWATEGVRRDPHRGSDTTVGYQRDSPELKPLFLPSPAVVSALPSRDRGTTTLSHPHRQHHRSTKAKITVAHRDRFTKNQRDSSRRARDAHNRIDFEREMRSRIPPQRSLPLLKEAEKENEGSYFGNEKIGGPANEGCQAEGLVAEMKRSQCYELIDQYCEHIIKNLSAMNKQRECPEECREAASSLMFAAARFADLPELRELRTMFSDRYGNTLDYYVNKQFTEKLKSDPPLKDMKLQLLQEIAAESGLEWDSKALENKLFNESAYDKNLSKGTNDSDLSAHKQTDGAAQKAATGYEYRHAREETPERKKDLPFYERKQTTRNEDRLPRKKECSKSKRWYDEHEPLKHMSIPPPYTKFKVNKAKVSSSDKSDSSNDKVKATEPTDAEGDHAQDDAVLTAKSRKVLKFFDGGRDQRDEEEKMMDRLLKHYSRKKGSIKNGRSEAELKPTSQHATMDSSSKVKNFLQESRWSDTPIRTSSLRVEPTSPTDTSKKHSRAASFHPDLLNGNAHVHPKLPDYDEFVARLAAFRGK
ncbi:Regulator of Vps4 activity in the MVB pathway protein [Perilla frutescens var. frutescens]|nr:Regulator of Vps4 activity in the MVB pathway protein [Perilla frutescens var. frutescens]